MSGTYNVTNQKDLNIAMSEINLGPHNSIQFLFAKLQLAQSELCKDAAGQYMKKIEQTQADQKECAEMIKQARELQNQAKEKDRTTTMPKEMVDFFKKHGIEYDKAGNDYNHTADEWDYNLKSLTNLQETLGTTTQTDMVYLQDYMSQYNSFLQGANSAIQDSMETLKTILRG